jgi:predicted nuclease of restriction endonuclease-like (RecB) superfamily
MMRFIVYSLSRQLSWTHFQQLIYVDDPLRREFYTELCRHGRWSVRTLREKIASMLYERTAISKQPEKPIKQELKSLRDGRVHARTVSAKTPVEVTA